MFDRGTIRKRTVERPTFTSAVNSGFILCLLKPERVVNRTPDFTYVKAEFVRYPNVLYI
jgi:hypothetical protein